MSTSSPARIAANRKNAALSSGPNTPEGKAASRRNALKHGLTGGGTVVPAEDLARIAEVARKLRIEYGPTTTIGLTAVDHAATLIVRLDRCGKHELALVADQVAAAKYDFNQARRDWADELFDGLAANPAAIFELESFPEGIDRLFEEWSSIAAVAEWTPEARLRLDLISDAGDGPVDLSVLIPAEVSRLEVAKAAIDTQPIDHARQHAADLALFGTSPEAILARRYEAATDRALDRAMKILKGGGSTKESASIPEINAPTAPLGSFLPTPSPQQVIPPPPMPTPPAVVPFVPEPPAQRPKRPDPKKLRAMRDRKRR